MSKKRRVLRTLGNELLKGIEARERDEETMRETLIKRILIGVVT